MPHPLVVHYKKSKYDVYVGRPSKWGNPFRLTSEKDRGQAIEQYKAWLAQHPEIIVAARAELKGKVLACWCAPKACHADVLARIANS